jgi:hypothetical protein
VYRRSDDLESSRESVKFCPAKNDGEGAATAADVEGPFQTIIFGIMPRKIVEGWPSLI